MLRKGKKERKKERNMKREKKNVVVSLKNKRSLPFFFILWFFPYNFYTKNKKVKQNKG